MDCVIFSCVVGLVCGLLGTILGMVIEAAEHRCPKCGHSEGYKDGVIW